MNKRSIFAAIVGLIMISMLIAPAFAKGPSKAKMGQNGNGMWDYWIDYLGAYNPMADMYVGLDYGAGSTETITTDGTVIDIINPSTLMMKMKMFDDYDFTDKDFNLFKFWLTDPVKITFVDGVIYEATEFIFIKMNLVFTGVDWTGEYTLQAYK